MADAIICPNCGAANPPGSKYCDQCSLLIQPGVRPAAPSPPPDPSATAGTVSQSAPPAALPAGGPSTPPAGPPSAPPVSVSPPPPSSPPQVTLSTPPLGAAGPPGPALPARRRGNPPLLFGGALLALGLFLGVGLTATLLTSMFTTATPTPLARSAVLPTLAAPPPGNTATLPGLAPTPTGAVAAGATPPSIAPTVAGTGAAGATPPAESTAVALIGLGRYKEAATALSTALAQQTGDPGLLSARAQAYAGLQRWTDAGQDAEQVLSRDAHAMPALIIAARARSVDGDPATAAADFATAVAVYPQNPAVYRERGEVYLSAGRPTDALADFKRAIALAPQDPTLWIDQGRAYVTYGDQYQEQPDQAIDSLTHALQLNPQSSAALYWRARVYHDSKGDEGHALADITQAIAIGPPTAAAYYLRAQIEDNQGDEKARLADLDLAVGVDPADPDPYGWRTDYYFDHGQYPPAIADISRVIDLNQSWDAYLQRSTLYLLQGEFVKATDDAQHAIAQAPDRPGGYLALAQVHFVQGRYPAALEQVAQAAATNKDIPADVLGARGRVYLRLHQPEKAAADLTAALQLDPSNPTALLGQAELALARQQPAAALTALGTWVDNSHGFGAGYVIRAGIVAGQGNRAAALQDLQTARQHALFPDERQAADALATQLGPGP